MIWGSTKNVILNLKGQKIKTVCRYDLKIFIIATEKALFRKIPPSVPCIRRETLKIGH